MAELWEQRDPSQEGDELDLPPRLRLGEQRGEMRADRRPAQLLGAGNIKQIAAACQFDSELGFRGRQAKQALQRSRRRLRMGIEIEQDDGAGFVRPDIRHLVNEARYAFVEGRRQRAEVTVHLKGKDLYAEQASEDLYAAIDMLVDKLDRQVCRHKDRVQDHHHPAAKRLEA